MDENRSSLIRLDDNQAVRLDDSRKSPAYFCRRKPVAVTRELVADLVAKGAGTGKGIRLCLHEGPDALLHDMIVVQYAGQCFRSHKHLEKGESYHMIEGEMGVVIFDDEGKVVDACRMDTSNTMVYGVGTGMYHTNFPLTDVVVYHESRPGPLSPGDSVFAPWGPDGEEEDATREFVAELTRLLP
ncbi:MAG: WbuC family cupin fold metalloprotein [Alphaproteobacteria bacterium]|jgi:cupin fold WbuC family metalloprotein|nr:WbuC family cupin fold metalloprotein [Alphaproteobacteria bacterium]